MELNNFNESEFYALYPSFDIEFYKQYDDFKYNNLNENKYYLMHHYDKNGKQEGRLCCKNEFYILYPHFDIDIYKQYSDLSHMNEVELLNHYNNFGRFENRITCHTQIMNTIGETLFDDNFYKTYYSDLSHMNKLELLNHYNNFGRSENRLTYLNHIIDIHEEPLFVNYNWNKSVCVIYDYNEIINNNSSQTNLTFYINYGLDKTRWEKFDIFTIILVDGNCEVLIPIRNDIVMLNKKSYNTFSKILNYLTQSNQKFNKFLFLNSFVFGPMFEDNQYTHWIYLYLKNGNCKNNDINNKLEIFVKNSEKTYNFMNEKLKYNIDLPIITKCNHLLSSQNKNCVVYSHYDKDNIIKDYVLQNIIILMILGYDIYFYTSSSKITNYDENHLPFKINYFPNKTFGSGTDWCMWNYCCKHQKMQKYEWIMLLNDSTAIGINGINSMKKSIERMRNSGIDFWGHWDSDEIEYHYHSSIYEFKLCVLPIFIKFAENALVNCFTKNDVVINCETKFITYLRENNINTNVVISIKDYNFNNTTSCISHYPLNLPMWINDKKSFAIKWKYVMYYLNNTIVSNEFREIFRFIHIGKYLGYQDCFNIEKNNMLNILNMKIISKNFQHKILDSMDIDITMNRKVNYNLFIVYYINAMINPNYFTWITSQLNIILPYNGNIYLVCTIQEEKQENFKNDIKNLFSANITILFNNVNQYEYPGIKKVWELSQQFNKDNDIIVYFHSKGITHCNVYEDSIPLLNASCYCQDTISNIDRVYEIFSLFPSIDKITTTNGGNGWGWYNYWIARGSYLCQVEKPILTTRRHYYEDWLGRKKKYNNHYYSDSIENTDFSIYENTLKNSYQMYCDDKTGNIGYYMEPYPMEIKIIK
jgi:hypothetical protein